MENLSFVSIIVPVYSSEATIEKCIESLLNQDYPKNRYEIIIVDNKSRDKTAQIVKSFPVHYDEERAIQSAYAARNRGIKQAKGQILAFIDSDCVASRDWLIKGIEGFEDARIGCVAGAIKGHKPTNFIEEYLVKRDMISQEEKPKDLPFPYAKTANAFYRKDVFNKIGLFEEKWISGGDADLSWRMQLGTNYKIIFFHNSIVFHRHRSTLKQMFSQCVKWGIGYTFLFKKYKDKMPKRSIKESIWIFYWLFYSLINAAIFSLSKKDSMPEDKREKYLDLIAFLGWEIGRIMGSVRNRVLYI